LEPPPEPVKVKVVLLPYLSHAPVVIADREGYFAEQGLEVEFVKLARSSEAIPALAQGELDVWHGIINVAVLNSMSRGAEIKFVADSGHIAPTGCAYGGLMARRDLVEAGGLDSPAQLQGKQVAVWPAFPDEYMVWSILNGIDLTLEDIGVADVPVAAQDEAFETGAIDLAFAGEPWITRMLKSGNAVLWMSFQQVIPDFQLEMTMYGPTLLEENRDAGRRFMVAYLKAVQQYNLGKTERNLELMADHTGLDLDLLEEACWPALDERGTIDIQSVLDFQAWTVEMGYLDSPLTAGQFWDPSFVDHASQVLRPAPR
jgi:NitT/TauT family transport system substrate-binding protein